MKHLTSTSSLLFVAALICSPLIASAAPSTPIDGGISLLVAAGIGYGAKKAAAKKKAK
jgi:hypothetical protein